MTKSKTYTESLSIFTGLSVFIGPLLIFLSEILFPKKVSCFDLDSSVHIYLLEDGQPGIPAHEILMPYRLTAVFLVVTASIMLFVGSRIFWKIHEQKHQKQSRAQHILMLLAALVLWGYVLILLLGVWSGYCANLS